MRIDFIVCTILFKCLLASCLSYGLKSMHSRMFYGARSGSAPPELWARYAVGYLHINGGAITRYTSRMQDDLISCEIESCFRSARKPFASKESLPKLIEMFHPRTLHPNTKPSETRVQRNKHTRTHKHNTNSVKRTLGGITQSAGHYSGDLTPIRVVTGQS